MCYQFQLSTICYYTPLFIKQFEAAQFLPRLVGAAKDGIFVSQSMLTDLLMPREGQYLLLSLFQAGGSLLTRTKRYS